MTEKLLLSLLHNSTACCSPLFLWNEHVYREGCKGYAAADTAAGVMLLLVCAIASERGGCSAHVITLNVGHSRRTIHLSFLPVPSREKSQTIIESSVQCSCTTTTIISIIIIMSSLPQFNWERDRVKEYYSQDVMSAGKGGDREREIDAFLCWRECREIYLERAKYNSVDYSDGGLIKDMWTILFHLI